MEKDKYGFESKANNSRKKRVSVAGVVLLLLLIIGVLAAILLPYKIISSKETVPYTATEEYYGTEPYFTTTQVKVFVPINDSKCDYQIPSYYVDTNNSRQGTKTSVTCSILNFASIPTDFIYYMYSTNSSGKELSRTSEKTVTVDPQELFSTTELVTTEVAASAYGCHVNPQIQSECRDIITFRETTKDQLVAKTRQVVRTRTVTLYRTDTVYKVVNLIFGNQMPWHNSWRVEGSATYYIPVKTG
jgi:hypothetical protein